MIRNLSPKQTNNQAESVEELVSGRLTQGEIIVNVIKKIEIKQPVDQHTNLII